MASVKEWQPFAPVIYQKRIPPLFLIFELFFTMLVFPLINSNDDF